MKLAQESLAGRAAILHMSGISQHELYGKGSAQPFTLDISALQERAKGMPEADINEIFRRIWNGGMPGLVSGKFTDRDIFYSSFIQTYIERDVSEEIDLVDKLTFRDFIRAVAARDAQILNLHSIAQDAGVSDDTAKRWMQILEKSDIVYLLRPYSNNLLTRTIKTPKLYFFDTGLVAYLTRYPSPEILQNGAMNGAILENYVVMEVLKSYINDGKECDLWYYHDRDNKEVDMVIQAAGELHPIEIKKTGNPDISMTGTFRILDKSSEPRGKGAVICSRTKLSAFNADNYIVPIGII